MYANFTIFPNQCYKIHIGIRRGSNSRKPSGWKPDVHQRLDHWCLYYNRVDFAIGSYSLPLLVLRFIMSLRQDSNLHDHSWSRDFPTTLAFTQAILTHSTMLSILLVQEFVTCSLRFCGLDYFITILEILQVSI